MNADRDHSEQPVTDPIVTLEVERMARENYSHSTRRAMLGREWDALTDDERSGWLRRASQRLADARTTQSAPEPSQAATEAHSDEERGLPEYLAEKDAEIARLTSERDAAQEHVAYHLRDYALNSDLTGDLAVDMAAHAGRLKIRAEAAEAKVARVEALHTPFDLYEPCQDEVTGCDRDDCTESVIDGQFFHGTEPVGKACDECRDEDGTFIEWPCATVRALDGDA